MSKFIPVLHSVSYAGVWQGQARLSVEAFLRKASKLDFPAVALVAKEPHLSPHTWDAGRRRELRAVLDGEGLALSALMGYTDFTCGLRRPGIPSAEMNASYIADICELCADLKCGLLRVFTGYRLQSPPYDAQYGEVVRGLQLAGERASEHDVTLVVQNHHDIGGHYKEFGWLLAEVGHPRVQAAFDCWACWLQGVRGEELREAVRHIGASVKFTTVADYKVLPQFNYQTEIVNYERTAAPLVRATAPGNGELDYESFFRGLHDIAYEGPVAYEMCAPLEGGGSEENLDRTARQFLEFLKEREAAG